MSENLDALRAQLEAAQAQAAAMQAALEAAEKEAAEKEAAEKAAAENEAAAGHAATSDVSDVAGPLVSDSQAAGHGTPLPQVPLSDFAQTMHAAYSFPDPTITLGTLIDNGQREPRVQARIPLSILNRHLLVAGATGSGKTRTLQLLTEGLSAAGTSVVLTDVKGDLTGIAEPGAASDALLERTITNGQPWEPASFPTELLTLGGVDAPFPGVIVRARIIDFGPILLARALSLNTTQEQSLQLIFTWADRQGLELIDLGDLRAVITFLTSPEGKEELATIGGVSKATAGVILRALATLEAQGGDQFFGDPAFNTEEFIRQVHHDGSLKGVVSILGVGDIGRRPALVSAVVMYLLANLFADLPEVGDVAAPKLAFVFDEAHLLFAEATKEFERQVVQTVRLIRSKGVSVIFVTQTPKDIPSDVLAQLGSRIQHALRAVTPDDMKKIKQSVETFPDTDLDLAEILTTLGTGQAVVTVLDPKGRPTPVMPTSLWAPSSVMGPASLETITRINADSDLVSRYAFAENPYSAQEALEDRAAGIRSQRSAEEAQAAAEALARKQAELDAKIAAKKAEISARAAAKAAEREAAAAERALREAEKRQERELREEQRRLEREQREEQRRIEREEREEQRRKEREEAKAEKEAAKRNAAVTSVLGSVLRSAGSALGREITRSIFGTRR